MRDRDTKYQAPFDETFKEAGTEVKVAGVQQLDLGIRDIASKGLRTDGQEKGIVLSPYRQQRWEIIPEVGLKFQIERDVTLVVTKEIELYFVVTWAAQIVIIECVSTW